MKNSTKIVSLLVFAFLLANVSFAQIYPKVKVTLNSGVTVEGKKGNITEESVSFMVGTTPKTFDLSEVSLIQAKKGKAGKWALGMGGGCLGIGLLTTAAMGGQPEYTYGQLAVGSIIWAGLFAGAGAIIGHLADDYINVYMNSKTSSLIKRFDLGLSSNKVTNFNLTLSYKF